jgi:uncharacterized delta-60 repeat protein
MPRRPTRLTLTPLEERATPAAAGALDLGFGVNGQGTYPVASGSAGVTENGIVLLPDGKIVLAGSDATANPTAVRLNRDGTLDTSFGEGGTSAFGFNSYSGGGSSFGNAIAVQPDGKVLVVGSTSGFSNGNFQSAFAIDRLSVDGSLDTTFGNGGRVYYTSGYNVQDVARAVAVQADGKIVVAGDDYFNGTRTSYGQVVRFMPDGSLDAGFGNRGAMQFGNTDGISVSGLSLTPDGRIVVTGTVGVGVAGQAGFGDILAVRVTSAGTLDPTFGTGGQTVVDFGGAETAGASTLQPDGKLVVVGGKGFGTNGNTQFAGVALRLNTDGTLDPTFGSGGKVNVDFGTQGEATAVAVQQNGKLVLAGNPRFVGPTRGILAVRLNADGSIDPTFGTSGRATVGSGDSTQAGAVAVQPDGGIVFAGASGTAFVAARLTGDAPPPSFGSFVVGGSPDGAARFVSPFAGGYEVQPAVTLYPNFAGTARVATADVNGDGVPDLITGPGPGGGPNVVVTDGKTGAKIADFNAFETTFTGGVFVAAADLNGDGKAEVVVTPDQGGGPVVAVYDGAKLAAGLSGDAAQVGRFLGIDDENFRGGARPALADLTGDSTPDLIVAAGFGGGPRVALFDGPSSADTGKWVFVRGTGLRGLVNVYAPPKLAGDFFVFEPTLRNGVFVGGGDLTGDGAAELDVHFASPWAVNPSFGVGTGGVGRATVRSASAEGPATPARVAAVGGSGRMAFPAPTADPCTSTGTGASPERCTPPGTPATASRTPPPTRSPPASGTADSAR